MSVGVGLVKICESFIYIVGIGNQKVEFNSYDFFFVENFDLD